MEYEEVVDIVQDVLESEKKSPASEPARHGGMIAIQAFDAEDGDCEPVRVVGVISTSEDLLDFVVIRTTDEEMFPTTVGSVWPRRAG